MHLKMVLILLLALCQLGQRFLSQLTTAGYMYEIIAGQDNVDDVSASAKFTALFDCWQDDSCLFVAKEKSSGKFVLKKAGEMLNKEKYSAVWKKNAIEMNLCLSNPCKNSGTCVDYIAHYNCTCVNGFTGKNCEIDIDECKSLPCANGGNCTDEVGNYTCSCAPGYLGRNCERSQFVLYQELLTWENARQKCIENGGDLASIGNSVELGIVTKSFAVSAYNLWIWVGLNDRKTEGQFVWSDGTTQVFPQWQVGEPSGGIIDNCAFFWFTIGKLYDQPCSSMLYYICKFN